MRFFLKSPKTTLSFYLIKAVVCLLYLLINIVLVTASTAYAFEEDKCQIIKVKACVDFGKRMVDGIESKDEC